MNAPQAATIARSVSGAPQAARRLFDVLARIDLGELEFACPDGAVVRFAGANPGPCARLEIADWDVCEDILRAGDIGLAEAYMAGRCDSPDLAALLDLAARNQDGIARASFGNHLGKVLYRLRHLLRANTRRGSRRNIAAHYDLGNDFYALWLDSGMNYSAALYGGDATLPLDQAQAAKHRRIADRLALSAEHRVLEVGCGWGGFALHAALERGCAVTGVTVSRRQLEHARARIAAAGAAQRVDLALCDYRDVDGHYDRIVSIEMFEAVGERYWPRFFRMIRDRLVPGGRALVQTITIAEDRFARYRRETDFIQQYVFPGGMLPTVARFEEEAGSAGLAVDGALRFGADYALTLAAWSRAFERALDVVRAQGYDEAFVRRWRFYLAYCRAGFASGSTDVVQFELSRPAQAG